MGRYVGRLEPGCTKSELRRPIQSIDAKLLNDACISVLFSGSYEPSPQAPWTHRWRRFQPPSGMGGTFGTGTSGLSQRAAVSRG